MQTTLDLADALTAGNLVPDAHVATILRKHGVRRLCTTATDFRKFDFFEVIHPLRTVAASLVRSSR
ncbi:MAG: hypothetical protein FGM15_06260 [Chthoniobacterales bacterium]|nr:hypothetical protein [Chthoniobacterales bacterium]